MSNKFPFTSSPPAKSEPQSQHRRELWSALFVILFLHSRITPSYPFTKVLKAGFQNKAISQAPRTFHFQLWQSFVSSKHAYKSKQNRFHQLSNYQPSARWVHYATSVTTFKLFQFEVRFINSWQTRRAV